MTVSSEIYLNDNLRFIGVSNSKVLFLLQIEVGCNKVQKVFSHQLGLQGKRIIFRNGCV